MQEFPVGDKVAIRTASVPDKNSVLTGARVTLREPVPAIDSHPLYQATHGSDADPGQWTYMNFGPFENSEDMQRWMNECAGSSDPIYMTVHGTAEARPVGMVSFLNFQLQHRTIELGNIWYVPGVRRSKVNTETVFLMLQECFDVLGYRRVEWKCDNLNVRSKRAAERLGFRYEGLFRQHFIVKGRNRDTAWFAMLDTEWQTLKPLYREFLYDDTATATLGELIAAARS